MQDFSKALWSVLKQYKKKLELKKKFSISEDSLTNEKTRCFDLDNELKELKSQCTCWKEASAEVSVVEMYDARAKLLPRQPTDHQEVNSGISSHYLKEFEQSENAERADPIVRISSVILAPCTGGIAKHHNQFIDQARRPSRKYR
ncbi:Kinesin-like protein [Abeliophyllum distichum]|uniref:Kinesin-like protein n=1 Tax=Abeliophyllum distichum TaxID=126358 RepID=A0ABD1SI22_9LAMI